MDLSGLFAPPTVLQAYGYLWNPGHLHEIQELSPPKNLANDLRQSSCSEDMIIVCELTTYFQLPLLIGAGELVDTTFMYPYLIRFSFNTYSLWRIFVQMMKFYGWKNIVLIRDCCNYPLNVTTNGLINILRDENIQPFETHFPSGSMNTADKIRKVLKEASRYGRIFVLSMDSLLLRKFMLQANSLGYCEGEYAFVALDLYQNDIIGSGKSGWKQRDTDDRAAKHAYASLFILSLMDKRSYQAYRQFEIDVQKQAQEDYGPGHFVDVNYHTGAFHDSVIMFASNVNLTVGEGGNVSRAYILPLTQRFWNVTWEGGASGRVYIDPWGDRSDDHSILHMTGDDTGEFVVVANYFGYKKQYEEVATIYWPGPLGTAPLNEPKCGYVNDDPLCQPKNKPITEITVGTAIAILVLLVMLGIFLYRKIQEDANLSSTDWLAQWWEITYQNEESSHKVRPVGSETTKDADSSAMYPGKFKKMLSQKDRSNRSAVPKGQQVFLRGNLVILRSCRKLKLELTREVRRQVKDVRTALHENILRYVGAILGPDGTAVLYEFCAKGTLQNMLTNDVIKLDDLFTISLINDLIKGLIYIQTSPLRIHGRLTSQCCWIDSRFALKIGDYGLPCLYKVEEPSIPDHEYYTLMLWKAPEVNSFIAEPTQEADVYSVGIILQEISLRDEPFGMYHMPAEELVKQIRKNMEPPFRPSIMDNVGPPALVDLMQRCWAQEPIDRPRLTEIKNIMNQLSRNAGQQGNLMDILLGRMEQYAQNLEYLVEEKTEAFLEEKRKSDELLNQVLPKPVAEQLKRGEAVHPEGYESVTIYFSDIVGFTAMSSESNPMQIVDFLNDLYTCFDGIIMKFDVYKVETIGDSYMCVSGLPVRNGLEHAANIARMALCLLETVKSFKIRHRPEEKLRLRIGIHSGPCVAGVVGLTMPRYCLFGDTVNTASRMESTGEALKIQISSFTKTILDTFNCFGMEPRGEIPVKGKGQVQTFWLLGEL